MNQRRGQRIDNLLRMGYTIGQAISKAIDEETHPEPSTNWRTNPDGSISQVDTSPQP